MKHLSFLVTLLVCASFLSGCAGYKVLPAETDATKAAAQEGLRFYRPQPYLIVSASADDTAPAGGKAPANPVEAALTYQIIYLPDYTKGYVLQRKGGLGTVDASAKLTSGWMLTELGIKTDSQLPQTIEAISKLIPTLIPAPTKATKGGGGPTLADIIGLYKIQFDAVGVPTLVKVR
jgi:hypothetical protein